MCAKGLIRHDLFLRMWKLCNALLISVPFAFGWFLYYSKQLYKTPFYSRGNWVVILLFFFLYTVFGRTYDAFLVSLNRISEMIYSQSLACFIADGLMYIIFALLQRRLPNILVLVLVFIGQIALATLWSYLVHKWYFRCFRAKRTVIIYDMREGLEDLISEYGLSKKFEIKAVCSADECLQNNMRVLKENEAESIYLSGVQSHDRNVILKYCIENNISAYVIPRIGDVIMSGARKMHLFHLPIFRVNRYNPTPEYLFGKRVLDLILSLIAFVIAAPFMLITAIAIIVEDGTPVFYKQVRLTKDRKEFKIIKFRSMRKDAEKDGIARLSTGDNDDRITKVGRIIRKVRIDELPQLLNIIKGEMSIVGPRPERPEIAEQYEAEFPEFSLRLQAKAGLTGPAQVFGKYNSIPYDKLMMDLMYIASPSLLEDLRIIFATVKVLFMPESTEGVEKGATTAMDNDSLVSSQER